MRTLESFIIYGISAHSLLGDLRYFVLDGPLKKILSIGLKRQARDANEQK